MLSSVHIHMSLTIDTGRGQHVTQWTGEHSLSRLYVEREAKAHQDQQAEGGEETH